MFNYSTQAFTYLILVIITSLINLICYYIISGVWGFIGYLLYLLITIPLIILWMYNIDCLTAGDCQIWSWVITAITLISVISTTILLIAIAVNPSLITSFTTTTIRTKTELPKIKQSSITPVAVSPTIGTSAVPPTVGTSAVSPMSDADQQHNMKLYEEMWKEDKQLREQQLQKQKYISEQFKRKDLTREEKNALWRQQLEYEYIHLVNDNKNLQKMILNAKGFPPEMMEEYKNMLIIGQRFIQQRDKMTIEYPSQLGNFNSETIGSIKLRIKLTIEQKQIIQQELLKPGLSNDEKRALQQQLVILQKQQDELTPKPGNILYDAYTTFN